MKVMFLSGRYNIPRDRCISGPAGRRIYVDDATDFYRRAAIAAMRPYRSARSVEPRLELFHEGP